MARTTLSANPGAFRNAVDDALDQSFPDYSALDKRPKVAVIYFSVVWSIFEFKAVNRDAHQESIEAFVSRCAPSLEQIREFLPAFDFFRDRYIEGHKTSATFPSLSERDTRIKDAIKDALLEKENTPTEKLTGLLLIAYCFRNNLFHGSKWDWGLDNQYETLGYATLVLTEALGSFPTDLD